MNMRSTKDLKEIVTGARAKSKLNGIAGRDHKGMGEYNNGYDSTAPDEEGAPQGFEKGKRV